MYEIGSKLIEYINLLTYPNQNKVNKFNAHQIGDFQIVTLIRKLINMESISFKREISSFT